MQPQPRLFRLLRDADSADGARMLAEGVQWTDGAVALRWHGRWPSTSTWDRIDALLAVHGTDTRTQFHWLSEPPPAELPTSEALVPSVWLPAPSPDGLCSRCAQPWPCLSCGRRP